MKQYNISNRMFIEEIIVANVTSIVLMIILLLSRYMTRRHSRGEEKIFNALIFIGIGAASMELSSFLIDGKSGQFMIALNVISNTLLYACTASVSVIWIWFVESNLYRDKKRLKKVIMPFAIVWAVLITALIGNIFGGYFFKVDENNIYSRELPGYIFYVFLAISFIFSIVTYIHFRIKRGQVQFFPIWMFLFPVILAVGIQAFWYGISLAWLGCGVGLTGIYINIQSKNSLIDGLTGLYNRAYIEHKLIVARENRTFVYSGIMLDIDSFKQINDTHGHSIGDEALRDASNILLEVADRKTLTFRFAGDEFIILIKLPFSRKDELEQITIDLENKIREECQKFNDRNNKPYKIVFSMGHAFYDRDLEDDAFFHNMDKAMYTEKQIHHKAAQKS